MLPELHQVKDRQREREILTRPPLSHSRFLCLCTLSRVARYKTIFLGLLLHPLFWHVINAVPVSRFVAVAILSFCIYTAERMLMRMRWFMDWFVWYQKERRIVVRIVVYRRRGRIRAMFDIHAAFRWISWYLHDCSWISVLLYNVSFCFSCYPHKSSKNISLCIRVYFWIYPSLSLSHSLREYTYFMNHPFNCHFKYIYSRG